MMRISKGRNKTAVLTIGALLIVPGLSGLTLAQRKAEHFLPDGAFWILGKPPKDFENFGGINVLTKRGRQMPRAGVELTNGTRLGFKSVTVKRDNFTFTTVIVRGVSYSFSGRFLKGGDFAAAELDQETPVLQGKLIKFKGGQKVAEANLKFTYFGGT